jgi:hypothetical protein
MKWGSLDMSEASDRILQDALKRRKIALEISPIDIKLLALRFGLTQGQIRGLLLQYADRPDDLAAAAEKLRQH